MDYSCKICGNKTGNKFFTVKEMQFGFRDEFIYCECFNCNCLQLVNLPEDLSKYYPSNYFSFQNPKDNFLKTKLNITRDRFCFGKNNLAGKILFNLYGQPTYISWLKNFKIDFSSRILDAGCGVGKLLYRMGNAGFKNLTGIDAFIKSDIHYSNGVNIFKKTLFEIKSQFDLVMMHHSLEHMEDQHKVFEKLSSIIPVSKYLLIRIPVCSSYAWKTYRENWFALEAPRHFFNHSEKSLKYLADKYGFRIFKTGYDSRSIQLWGSEQYKRDIPLTSQNSYFINPDKSIFKKEEIENFEKETVRLNTNGEGDQVVFYLQKI